MVYIEACSKVIQWLIRNLTIESSRYIIEVLFCFKVGSEKLKRISDFRSFLAVKSSSLDVTDSIFLSCAEQK